MKHQKPSLLTLDELMALADERMDQATLTKDDNAWIKHYMIWLFLYSLKNRLPWPARGKGL